MFISWVLLFVPEMFGQIPYWGHRACSSQCGKVFNYKFYVFNRYRTIQVTFIFDWVLTFCVFQGICQFHLSGQIHRQKTAFIIFLCYPLNVCRIFSFAFFFILDVGNKLIFFLVSLSIGLSILSIFSKNQLLVSLIFSIIFSSWFHWFLYYPLQSSCFEFNLFFFSS